MTQCINPDCGKTICRPHGRGLCNACYKRFYRAGTLNVEYPIPATKGCRICQRPLKEGATVDVCNRKDRLDCQAAFARAWKVLRLGPLPPCSHCGLPIGSRSNKYGVCFRDTCRKEYDRVRRGAPKPSHCELCGDRLLSNNSMGICTSPTKPACRREYGRRWYQEHRTEIVIRQTFKARTQGVVPRTSKGAEHPNYAGGEHRICQRCYLPLGWKSSQYWIRMHGRALFCKKCWDGFRRECFDMMDSLLGRPGRRCEVCEGPINKKNAVGVCVQNDECLQENQRRNHELRKQRQWLRLQSRRTNASITDSMTSTSRVSNCCDTLVAV